MKPSSQSVSAATPKTMRPGSHHCWVMQAKRMTESGRRESVRRFGIVSRRSGIVENRGRKTEDRRFSCCPLSSVLCPLAFSALRELEAAAGALAAVLLAFLHTTVAGQVARVAELLDHA